jgi:hypothetical protein
MFQKTDFKVEVGDVVVEVPSQLEYIVFHVEFT